MQYTFILISIALFIIILLAIITIFRRLAKLQKSNVLLELESEVNELVLGLNQTADRNINILEEKINNLSRLLNDADKRIKILGTEAGKMKSEPVTYNQLGKVPGEQVRNKTIPKSHPEDQSELKYEKQLDEIPKKDRIIELHNNGFTSSVIASRVGLTIGEVELIISLVEGR